MMTQHFVRFYSPGTFVSESNTEKIDAWDIDKAVEIAKSIVQRHNARPYGFEFITRGREDGELDSKVISRSAMYHLGGKIETLEELEARNDPEEKILRNNMRSNKWDRVVVNTNSWKWTSPLEGNDIVLDVDMGEWVRETSQQ
jgi:hypothetical protein